jgi:hypothetical protein
VTLRKWINRHHKRYLNKALWHPEKSVTSINRRASWNVAGIALADLATTTTTNQIVFLAPEDRLRELNLETDRVRDECLLGFYTG